MRHLELIVEATASELSSAIWYLKQRGLVASDDKSSMHITVDGMDFLEKTGTHGRRCDAVYKGNGNFRSPSEAGAGAESVLTTLNRALGRNSTQAQGEVVR